MIKKGNKVKIIAGKDKRKEGEVIEIDRSNNRAKVKGINIIKKHEKTTKEKKGGIISKENFIHISNLKNLDSQAKKENKKCTQLKSEMQKLLTLKKIELVVYGVFRVFFIGHVLFSIFKENINVPLPFYLMVVIYFCGVYYAQKLWKTMDRVI